MNLIIRILAVLLALLMVAFATVLLITPQVVADVIGRLEEVSPIARIAAVIILYLIALAVITLRFRSRPRTDGDMLYVRAAGAQAALTVASVRDRILKSVAQVPGVASVEAELKSINGRADVELYVETADDRVNIPEKQREIYRTLEQVIKKQLGVDLANRPRVNIQLGRSTSAGGSTTSSTDVIPAAPVVAAAPMVTPAAVPVDETPVRTDVTGTQNSVLSESKPNASYGVSTGSVSASSTPPVPLPSSTASSSAASTSAYDSEPLSSLSDTTGSSGFVVDEFDDPDTADAYDDEPDFMDTDDDPSDPPRSYPEPL